MNLFDLIILFLLHEFILQILDISQISAKLELKADYNVSLYNIRTSDKQ